MKDLKGSKTEENLNAAFSGEANAYCHYMIFAEQARKDGYIQIENIFTETANNEKIHAKLWYKWLHGDQMTPTLDNLKTAAGNEHWEATEMYTGFAKTAEEEGYTDIAAMMRGVGGVEASHEARYRKLIDNIEDGEIFARPEAVIWQCLNCGHLQKTKEAPEKCPVCLHPKAYFQLVDDNY